jgi:hypothetical protein
MLFSTLEDSAPERVLPRTPGGVCGAVIHPLLCVGHDGSSWTAADKYKVSSAVELHGFAEDDCRAIETLTGFAVLAAYESVFGI